MVKSGEETLLEKYDLLVDQLDYKFIENCKDVKTLERILIVLRSGEEGIFPDLIKFCENRLNLLAPKSRLLNRVSKILNYSELPENERSSIENDIEDWSSQAKFEENIKSSGNEEKMDLPPVRGKEMKIDTIKKKSESSEPKLQSKKSSQRNYADWDKFDVEEELRKLDDNETNETIIENKKMARNYSKLSENISVSGLSEKECQYIANLEKNKGNEAFKARDYEEAVLYYTRSLSAFRSTVTLNNRAQAYIKLKNYFAAIHDCTEVISLEPTNIKALYRRGMAYKENAVYDLAMFDFTILLELEPENKLAKEQLKEIKQLKLIKPEKKVLIEEIKTEENKETFKEKSDESSNGTYTRMKIEEVSKEENTAKLTNINFSSDEDDDCPQLPQKVKNMLQINKSRKKETQTPKSIDKNGIDKMSVCGTKRKEKKTIIVDDCKELPIDSVTDREDYMTVQIQIEDYNLNEDLQKSKNFLALTNKSKTAKQKTLTGDEMTEAKEHTNDLDKNESTKLQNVTKMENSTSICDEQKKATEEIINMESDSKPGNRFLKIEQRDFVSNEENVKCTESKTDDGKETKALTSECKMNDMSKVTNFGVNSNTKEEQILDNERKSENSISEYSKGNEINKIHINETKDNIANDFCKYEGRRVENKQSKINFECKTEDGLTKIKTFMTDHSDTNISPELDSSTENGNSISNSFEKRDIEISFTEQSFSESAITEKEDYSSSHENQDFKHIKSECKIVRHDDSTTISLNTNTSKETKCEIKRKNSVTNNSETKERNETPNYDTWSDTPVIERESTGMEDNISDETNLQMSKECRIKNKEYTSIIHKSKVNECVKMKNLELNFDRNILQSENKTNEGNSDCNGTNKMKNLDAYFDKNMSQLEDKVNDVNSTCNSNELKKVNDKKEEEALKLSCKSYMSESDIQISEGRDSYNKVTPYEFLCMWWSNNIETDSTGAEYLLQIRPEELPSVISNKIDASSLHGLLRAIYSLCEMGKLIEGESYLHYLTQVPRIGIASMFLSKTEIQDIHHLFSTLENEQGIHMKYVNKILQI